MKKYLLASVAVLAFAAAGAASAADLPSRRGVVEAPAVYVPPAFTWTGFYAGVNAGYSFSNDGRATTTGSGGFETLVGAGVAPGSLRVGDDGFIGGGQIGYNWQYGQFVLGIEADIQYIDNKGGSAFVGAPILGTQLITAASSELTYLGTVRGRLGYLAFDRTMIYATGGLAYGDVEYTANVNGVQNAALAYAGRRSDTKFGWTIGGGVEYALTNNWTLKGEYLYYDLGKDNVATAGNAAALAALPGVAYTNRVETTGHIVRAGLNYKF